MRKIHLLFTVLFLSTCVLAQDGPVPPAVTDYDYVAPKNRQGQGQPYLLILEDARIEVEAKFRTIFALDDRASLSANPHFQAMWNLIKLGASLEALLQGMDEPLNDIDLAKKFGHNGYNKTVIVFLLRYAFGESSDLKLQRHFLELGVSPGYFREGGRGMNIHFDYRMNIAKTNYGAGGASLTRTFDHEIFVGARAGFDWSFGRSEGEAGFFTHLNEEIERIADENEFTASQLIMLENLAETSKVLLPEDVGGRAFHAGPIAGARISKKILKNTRIFGSAMGFYDVMDLASGQEGQENKRSQHHISLDLGINFTIGAEGQVVRSFF